MTFSVRILLLCMLIPGLLTLSVSHAADQHGPLQWQAWNEALFEQAKRENKFVLLDLEAVWCHWCHVMEARTYHDPEVVRLLKSRYITVKVDQDANPDLAVRYEDYGWPATIIFAPDGSELVKRRGFIRPEAMAVLLQAVIDDPTPGPSVSATQEVPVSKSNALSQTQRARILADVERGYDTQQGGWNSTHKFILAANVEYALIQAQRGDVRFAAKARQTLDAALRLVDPVWGGFYQYSDRGRWDSPHFEKIMSIQADNLRLYTLAYRIFKEPRYLRAARDTERYLAGFWTSPGGAFYTSQYANISLAIDGHAYYPLGDVERRKLGMPRIDTNLYARENGWAIRGLAALYDATGDQLTLQRALRAADWVIAYRALPGGGFRHGAQDRAGPYLGDTLAMAEGFLALYVSTADRQWLQRAQQASDFMNAQFAQPQGYATAVMPARRPGVFASPVLQMEENVAIARLNNLLFHYSGNAQYQVRARLAMDYLLGLAELAGSRYLTGPLIAADELAEAPVHLTIVGAKSDPAALALQQQAIRYPAAYRRIEWWDMREGRLPNPDVQYPQMDKPAAYVCVNNACSTPIFEPARLFDKADLLLNDPP